MARILKDGILETTTTVGLGDYTLAGAVTNFRPFSSELSNGDTVAYTVSMGTDYESGIATYNSGPNTLTRTTVLESSNADAAVNWGAGTKSVAAGLISVEIRDLVTRANSGFLARTAARTYLERQLQSGDINELVITNPDGVSGDPSLLAFPPPGGGTQEVVTIASGLATPANRSRRLIDLRPETGSSDILDHLDASVYNAGDVISIRNSVDANEITVASSNALGVDDLELLGNHDWVLNNPDQLIDIRQVGSSWKEIRRSGCESPIAPTLEAGWSNQGGGLEEAGYYRDSCGLLHIKGMMAFNASITDGNSSDILILPVGRRPAEQLTIRSACRISSVQEPCVIQYSTSGEVTYIAQVTGTPDLVSIHSPPLR